MFSLLARQKRQLVATITKRPGTFSVDVIGEDDDRARLEKICGGRTFFGRRLQAEARLVIQDDKPQAGRSVVVLIEGETVGYLDEAAARRFRKSLAAIAPKAAIAVCPAIIVRDMDAEDGGPGQFGVRLDLPTR